MTTSSAGSSEFTGIENRMKKKLEERKQSDSFRQLIPSDSSFIDFCSNDYLGFARSIEMQNEIDVAWNKIKKTDTNQLSGSGGSRLLAGNSKYAEVLEQELASFYKSESFLLFNSGYTANLSLFSCIPQRGDTIIFDELIHASVRDGIRLSGAKAWGYSHNNSEEVETLLKKAEGEIFVVAEAVYSMDGDECPLKEIILLCEKYNASFILDEAHSNGIYGVNGEGIAVMNNLQDKIFARLYTFGKAAGCHGAGIAGSEMLRNYLINFARPFIYTTSLPLYDLATIACSVRRFSKVRELREQLSNFIQYFRKEAEKYSSIRLLPSLSPIQGIIIGGNQKTRIVAEKCRSKKFDVRAILSPTVPEGQERLRVIIHAFNHPLEMDELLKIIDEAI
ncbi:pyridoxal phosphate-dependent aminotransferase family protein [soil metagenome]